jgi:transglutaminase-like putative cysteine protease
MRLVVRHDTTYYYAPPARQVVQRLLLTPRNCSMQHIRRWRIEVDQDCRLHEREDAFGNTAHSLSVEGSIASITTSVEGEIETFDTQGVVQGAVERFPAELYLRQTGLTTPDAAVKALSEEIAAGGGDILTQLHALSAKLDETLDFDTEARGPGISAADTLSKKGGSAKDLANLYVSVARGFGAPARCVSGYQRRAAAGGMEVVSHAWAEGLIPGLGWVGFDPTCGLSPDDSYIRSAIGLDSLDTAPIRGSHFGGESERMEVKVRGAASGGQSQS